MRCVCGLCQDDTSGGRFAPGHDQRLRANLETRVGGLLVLRDLVEAIESYARGKTDSQDLARRVRVAFAAGRPT